MYNFELYYINANENQILKYIFIFVIIIVFYQGKRTKNNMFAPLNFTPVEREHYSPFIQEPPYVVVQVFTVVNDEMVINRLISIRAPTVAPSNHTCLSQSIS